MHKSQIFFYLLSVFILGVFVASFFDFSGKAILIILILSISFIALSGFKNRYIILGVFLVLFFIGGVARFNSVNDDKNITTGYEVTLRGYIDSEPEIDDGRSRFILNSEGKRILITTSAFPVREYGDQIEIRGKLDRPVNFISSTGQANFDYVAYLKKDGIRLIIFYPKEIRESSLDLGSRDKIKIMIYHNIFVVKNKFQDAINLSIPEPNAAFVNGILLGTRQNISDELKENFSKTGTTHILAISGYNIMIILEVVLLGLIWFFRRRTAFWISVIIVIIFVILTGASASVVRAAVMGLLLSFARGYGRLYDQKNSIILAGAIMIWINPLILVFDIGFQLSFAAVLGLAYLYPYLESKLYKIPKLDGVKELILMTFSAQVAVSPLLIYYFRSFSLISLPANILILPFVPAAMLMGFVAGLVGMLYLPAGQFIGYIAWAITTYQIAIVNYLALY